MTQTNGQRITEAMDEFYYAYVFPPKEAKSEWGPKKVAYRELQERILRLRDATEFVGLEDVLCIFHVFNLEWDNSFKNEERYRDLRSMARAVMDLVNEAIEENLKKQQNEPLGTEFLVCAIKAAILCLENKLSLTARDYLKASLQRFNNDNPLKE